jgi:hypothetical protein
MNKYTYIGDHCVTDPDSNGDVHIEIWKDNNSGGVFAIDASFLEQVDDFYNPFNGEQQSVEDEMPDTGETPW